YINGHRILTKRNGAFAPSVNHPLEFRHRLMPQDDILSRLSSAMKECAEAKQAVMLNAPEHQKLKEVSEGIASLFRLMPEQTGALMTIVSSMLGVM
ncbi:toxin YdaT family protein, partial [Klebsiella pneumoniae]